MEELQDRSPCKLTAFRLHDHDSFLKIVPAPADRFWMDVSTNGWANRCLPLRIANQAGWHVLNDRDFEVEWTGKNALDSLQIRFLDGRGESRNVKSSFGYGILTWYLPYLFRTSPGYNLQVRGPANSPKDGVSPLEGLVETDWSDATFSVNWKITRAYTKIRFSKGDPVCLLLPQKRGSLEALKPEIRNIESEPELLAKYEAWIASRRNFAAEAAKNPPKKGESLPWQGHYTRGTDIAGKAAPEHQTKLHLQPFHEVEPPLRTPPPVDTTVAPQGAMPWWKRVLGQK